MDVSIIIVTRNTCALTVAAIRSVLEAPDRLTKEIIVVDNGSSDDTPTILPRMFPQIRFVRLEGNLGFARACNHAATSACGGFILLLNSDARPQSEALARAVEWMRAHPRCAVVGAQLLNTDGSLQNSIANFPTLATELLNKSLLRRLFPRRFPGKEQNFEEAVDVETVVGAFLLVRKPVWDALGGLDERFFFFFEETDFCLRAHRAGHKVTHLPEVRVWHHQGGTADQVSTAARIEYWRSRYAYFRKNRAPGAVPVLRTGLMVRLLTDLLAALLMNLLTAGQSVRWRKKSAVTLALFYWHLRGCPAEVGLPR